MEEGYIKLYRSSLSNPLFRNPKMWHVWEYCLLKANHEDKKIIWNSEEMIVERGSFITGRKQMALETGLSEQNIRTTIATLIRLTMLAKSTTKSTNKFSYITICNYDKFQSYDRQTNHQKTQQLTSNQPATNQQLTTNKNDKNDKKKNIYGEFQNVKLTEEEYQKLITFFGPSGTNERIENLSEYIASKGKKYLNHYATILSWERKNPGQSLTKTLDPFDKKMDEIEKAMKGAKDGHPQSS